MADEKEIAAAAVPDFEYVSSTVSALSGDGIVAHVVNHSDARGFSGVARAIVYQNTGAGAVTVADSGLATLPPTWAWSFAFTVSASGEYWVVVQASSDALVPQASFERVEGGVWKPVVSYRPGDFAVYSLNRRRIW